MHIKTEDAIQAYLIENDTVFKYTNTYKNMYSETCAKVAQLARWSHVYLHVIDKWLNNTGWSYYTGRTIVRFNCRCIQINRSAKFTIFVHIIIVTCSLKLNYIRSPHFTLSQSKRSERSIKPLCHSKMRKHILCSEVKHNTTVSTQ